MEENTNHISRAANRQTSIDLTDMDDVIGQVAVAPRVAAVAAIAPSEEYMDDVMSITSQSRGGSLVADAPEDEEVREHFAFWFMSSNLTMC
jgi:hypothetical protein